MADRAAVTEERVEKVVFDRPDSLTKRGFTYCQGCGHGAIQRLVAELIDEFGIKDRTIGMVALGGLNEVMKLVETESIAVALENVLPERRHKLIPLNLEALKKGAEFVKSVSIAK